MTTTIRIPSPGLADPVHDAQRTFRVALDALARPTVPVALELELAAPGGLTRSAGALVLALCDDSTTIWLDETLSADEDLIGWIGFHTGARAVEHPSLAAFAVVADSRALPTLGSFALGTDETPHTSTTIIACVREPGAMIPLRADGPGFPEPALWNAPVGPAFAAEWAANRASFPRGVDLLFAEHTRVTGLPRTTGLTLDPTTATSTASPTTTTTTTTTEER
jgi:alpha-D-ribose 1-methylphosphonate 5-triphosphate synthase subunit PhnH